MPDAPDNYAFLFDGRASFFVTISAYTQCNEVFKRNALDREGCPSSKTAAMVAD